MKCKVINSSKSKLEKEVNDWLKSGKYHIIDVSQTEGGAGYITLTIFYEDLIEQRKRKLEKINRIHDS